MEQAYAQALMQLIEGGMQPKKALHALVESLKVKGREALLPRIARAFERLAQREMHKNAVVMSVAKEKDVHAGKRDAKELLETIGAESKDVEVRIDEDLIGGWRLEGRGMLVDRSFKKALLQMYNRATA
ncbi:MAG TPA: F0F1 ATP synthase subunit delta [Candidatus Paceibacterota bacterium]|jgi:F0F1-type ATP synthase delta subunit|nr:F0F1 ATP synthase subunit delta [Candidatus Paceibacterota bacterium]